MSASLQTGLHVLVVLRWFIAGSVATGFVAWIVVARRRSSPVVSRGQRAGLAVLILGALLARALIGEGFDAPTVRDATDRMSLPANIAKRIDLALPLTTWTEFPEIRWLDQRPVLMLPPPAEVEWLVDETASAVSLDFGFDPGAYERGHTNGADFSLALVSPRTTREIFRRRLEPAKNAADRGRQHALVLLPPFEPGARLVFRTGPGEFGDAGWDWIYLGHLQFRRGAALRRQQFPHFNRPADRVDGDNSAFLPGDDGEPYLLAPTPSVLTFRLHGGETFLDFDYGFVASAYANGGRTNGAIFRVELQSGGDGAVARLFEHYPKPVEHPVDRALQHAHVALPPARAGDRLMIRILPGDNNDASWDHTFINRLVLE